MTTTLSPTYHRFAIESLAECGSDRAQFEQWCEDNAPRVIDNRESHNDLLDRLDGSTWLVARESRTLDLPTSFSDPVWRKMRSILSTIVRECAAA